MARRNETGGDQNLENVRNALQEISEKLEQHSPRKEGVRSRSRKRVTTRDLADPYGLGDIHSRLLDSTLAIRDRNDIVLTKTKAKATASSQHKLVSELRETATSLTELMDLVATSKEKLEKILSIATALSLSDESFTQQDGSSEEYMDSAEESLSRKLFNKAMTLRGIQEDLLMIAREPSAETS